ncbi:MAG: FMN-binding protein [Chloroflexi bacterium]|nr:FMN-binding protein [Chloroflexota bacterium]
MAVNRHRKMSRGLVALSSSAIAAVYFAGVLATQGADVSLGTGESTAAAANPVPIVSQAGSSSAPAPSVAFNRSPSTVPASPPTVSPASPSTSVPGSAPGGPSGSTSSAPSSSASTGAAYRDGTYTGSGTSRRGGFTVAVTIQGGRIANVALTQVTTQYPASRIAALPGQVVARQSAQVDRVSGATYSTQAFQQAVGQALSKARQTTASAGTALAQGQGA